MSEQQDLIRSICAVPSDDTVRVAYADWLDDRAEDKLADCPQCNSRMSWFGRYDRWYCGSCRIYPGTPIYERGNDFAARAEFIRLEVELWKYPQESSWLEQMPVEQWNGSKEVGETLCRLAPLVQRHTELCNLHVRECGTWSREFIQNLVGRNCFQLSAAWYWGWTRGFISHVTFSLQEFTGYAPALFRLQPIERLVLTGVVRDGIVFRTSNGHHDDIPRDLWEELEIPQCTSSDPDCWGRGTHAHMTQDELSPYLVNYGRKLVGLPRIPCYACP